MRLLIRCFILSMQVVLLIFGTDQASGNENFSIRTFTTADGLPHKHITSIAQDQQGFLWIATWDGLSRYDGYEFRNYYHRPGDSASIPYFTVDQVLIDRYNTVWVSGYPYASAKYNPKGDDFIRLSEEGITQMVLDQNDEIWISTLEKLKKWDQEEETFTAYDIQFSDSYGTPDMSSLYSIETDHNGDFWMFFRAESGDMFIFKSTSNDGRRILFDFFGDFSGELVQPGYSGNRIRFFPFESASGKYWILSGYGLFLHDDQQKRFNACHDPLPMEETYGLESSLSKKIKDAIACYNIPKSGRASYSFNGEYISAFLIDRQGTVWLGFYDDHATAGGLARFIPTPSWFTHYFTGKGADGALTSFFPILKDQYGMLWAPPRNRNAIFQVKQDGVYLESKPLDDRFWRTDRHPRSLLEDRTGIWIGYNIGFLLFYDFNIGNYEVVMNTSGQEPDDFSRPSGFIHLAKEGEDLIIFSYHAIYRYQIRSNKIVLLNRINENKAIYSMQKDVDKGWIVGYAKGMVRYFDRDFNLVSEFRAGSGLFNVEAVCKGDNNEIWAALLGEGIARIDMDTGESQLLTTADGLSNNTTYSILKDNTGNLWITTNQGISRFDPVARHFRQFGEEEGLQIEEFNSDGFHLSPGGEMFFAGVGGVVGFFPDSINLSKDYKQGNPLVFTEIFVSGMPRYFQKAVYQSDTLFLHKGDNNFRLTFACLDFRDAEKIRYRYRLMGEENGFTETNFRNRSVNYANLSPGNYLFELEATNSEGDWISGRKLAIIIPSFYHQTLWFRLMVITLVLLLFSWLVFSYNRHLRLRFKQRQSQLRLESLRGQMNPHFIFNTLNSINYFISQNDRLSANRYIADFSRLVRTILGNMSADYILFLKEYESLRDYLHLEHLRFGDKFDYSVEIQEGLLDEEIFVFPGLVQPFVENAIWHGVRGLEGRKGMVRVNFFRDGNQSLHCTITDDGIGRTLSQQRKGSLNIHNSRGLKIVQERLDLINALRSSACKIRIDDLYPGREEPGTIVTIDIPVKS